LLDILLYLYFIRYFFVIMHDLFEAFFPTHSNFNFNRFKFNKSDKALIFSYRLKNMLISNISNR